MEQGMTTAAPTANSGKQGSGKGLKIVSVVALAIAICGIGFGIFGMIQSAEKDSQISDLKAKNSNASETVESSADERYKKYTDTLAKGQNISIFGEYFHWAGSSSKRETVLAVVKNSHLTITDLRNNSVITEAEDASNVFYLTEGNGGIPYIYLTKKDGSLWRVDLSEHGGRKLEKIEGYKNITLVYAGSDLFVHYIDIDGNEFTDGNPEENDLP